MTKFSEWPKPVSDELLERQKIYLEHLGGKVAEAWSLAMAQPDQDTTNSKSKQTQRIRELREQLGLSMTEAKRIVVRESLIEDIEQAESLDDIKFILRTIVEHWNMK